MSEFYNLEPMFQKTYLLVLKYFKNNLIDVLDEHPWMSRLSWVQFVVYVLAVASHTGGVLDMMSDGADLVKLSSDLSATLVLWQVTFLYIQIQAGRKLIRNLILHLGSEWRIDNDLRPGMIEEKRKTADKTHMWVERFYRVLTVFMHLYFCLPLLFEIVKHFILKSETPFTTSFKLKMPFKYDDNFVLFFIMYMADYGILYNTGFLITSDLLLVNVSMNHLRILFVLLRNDLKSIAHSSDEPEEKSRSRLKEIIPKHGTLLRMMVELSEAYGAIFLIHLGFFSGTMCFFGFAARSYDWNTYALQWMYETARLYCSKVSTVTLRGTKMRFQVHCSPESIKNLLASSFILICIYSCCSYGQDLTDASLDVANAAYDGTWSRMPRDCQMCILLIITRSQKAYYIKSTSFTDISLQSFTKILNVTWSFLSLIDKVYEG